MSAFGTGSFYSAPHPENIGSPGPEEQFQYSQTQPPEQQTQTADEPRKARPVMPPYLRTWENSAASFAADAPVEDPTMQAQLQAPNTGPSMGSLPLIAGGLFLLWVLFKGDQS